MLSFCQAQVQVQVGWRSGEGQEGQEGQIWTWAIPYFWFSPSTHHHHHHKLFFGFKGAQTYHMDLGRVGMTQVWSEMVRTSR